MPLWSKHEASSRPYLTAYMLGPKASSSLIQSWTCSLRGACGCGGGGGASSATRAKGHVWRTVVLASHMNSLADIGGLRDFLVCSQGFGCCFRWCSSCSDGTRASQGLGRRVYFQGVTRTSAATISNHDKANDYEVARKAMLHRLRSGRSPCACPPQSTTE